MNTSFYTLCTLEVTHAYHPGVCRDFTFLIPGDTAQWLQRGRLMAKALDGRLHLLFQTAEGGGPLVLATGTVVRVGLRLANSFFGNFTPLGFAPGSAVAIYDNSANAAKLGAPATAAPTGPVFAHTLSRLARPADVTLKNALGSVATETVTAANRSSVSFDLAGQASGLYTVAEEYPGGVQSSTAYYLDPELSPESLFGIVEITIVDALYAAPAAFHIDFDAREETLKYYVVATNYPAVEFDTLAVSDLGFGADSRPEVKFTKVAAAAFTPAEIAPALLGNADAKIVMFRSNAPVKRSAQGRQRIQLTRNGTVVIPNLPQPGAERPNADLIVHLSKPKP